MEKTSLQKKFIFYLSTTIVITILFGTLLFSYFDYKNRAKSFRSNIDKIVKNIYPFYQTYLWQVDIRNITNTSKTLLSINRNLCKISVKDENNKLIFAESKKNMPYCQDGIVINITKKVFHKNIFIGTIHFSFSKNNINSFSKKIFTLNLVLAFLLSLLVIAITIILFKYFFSKPIVNIIESLKKVANGNYKIKFNGCKYSEFNEIVENLNKMIHEINSRDKKNFELTNRLHELINNMPGGLVLTDIRGNFKEINDSLSQELMMPKEEILHKNFEKLSENKENFDYFEENIGKIVKNGYNEFEWEFVKKTGEKIPVFIKGKKTKFFDNETIIIFTITNIGYIKKLEKEILSKEKLKSLSILAGGIAHDFNNILASISGTIELIQIFLEQGKYDEVGKRIKKIFHPIETAKSLTHQLATFSKGEAPLKKTFFKLEELIKDTTSFILTGSSIEVNYTIDKNLNPVRIDPEQISLVIQNIVLNAKQALKNKGKIEIKAINENTQVKIYIKDNGPGIPKEIIEKIWEPYYTTKSEGTGLGLSIVYSIIKKHGGDIRIHSETGKFTEFEISLPAVIEKKQKTLETGISNNDFCTVPSILEILVMDDEEIIRETLKELLEHLGHNVTAVSSGEEAIKAYTLKKFDVVFLDITVKGGMGGKECIKELKKTDKKVRAIVYSGYPEEQVMINYREYGFCSSLKKPFTLDNLKKTLEECLKNNNGIN